MNKSIANVKVLLDVRLGKKELYLSDIENIGEGSVIELDKLVGETVDVYINNSLIAYGEVVVIDDKFGVRISDIIAVNEEDIK